MLRRLFNGVFAFGWVTMPNHRVPVRVARRHSALIYYGTRRREDTSRTDVPGDKGANV
jgi:hypothetical protein